MKRFIAFIVAAFCAGSSNLLVQKTGQQQQMHQQMQQMQESVSDLDGA